jgi:acylglycerol lipase
MNFTKLKFVCFLVQISEKVKPHPLVITALTQVEDVIPKWKIVPTKDVIDAAFKDPAKREKVGEFKLLPVFHF